MRHKAETEQYYLDIAFNSTLNYIKGGGLTRRGRIIATHFDIHGREKSTQ